MTQMQEKKPCRHLFINEIQNARTKALTIKIPIKTKSETRVLRNKSTITEFSCVN